MDHALYVALKRFRLELWRSVPPFTTARWLFNKHPKWVIPVALTVTVGVLVVIMGDWASRG